MKWAELPGKSQVLGSHVSEGGDENMRMEYTVSHIPIALGQLFTSFLSINLDGPIHNDKYIFHQCYAYQDHYAK